MKPNRITTRIRLLYLAAAAMLALPTALSAATQYGAGAFTWDNGTTAKWSPTPGGPLYNSVWTAGNDAVFGGTAGTVTVASPTAHNLTFTTTGYILSGPSTLTLNGSAPTLWLPTGIAGATIGNNTATVLAGSAGLTKGGFGTVTLNGSAVNTVTGGLSVNPGGTLTLDLRNLTPATDLINNGNVLTLAGGTLNLTGKGSAVTSQTFASTTLNNGGSVVTLTQNSATSLTGALGAITHNTGGTLLFSTVPNTTTTIATTSTGNESSGILAPWAAVGATTALQYATNNGSGQIVSYTGATTTGAAANLSDVTSASVNYAFGATPSPTLTGAISANTLRFTGAAGTVTTAGNNITLNSLMNAGSGALTISADPGTSGNLVVGGNKELILWSNAQAINIYSPIVDNSGGASSVVFGGNNPQSSNINANVFKYTGSTTVNLGYGGTSGMITVLGANGTWSYTGDMTINGGTVWFRGDLFAGGGSFTVGNMTVNAGGTLKGERGNFVAKTGCALTLNGGKWNENNGFGGSWTGPISLTADSTIDTAQTQTITGVISGSFGFSKTSAGTLVLKQSLAFLH